MPFYRGTRYPLMRGASGELYLLDDEFRDTLAAGAVNGTLATPGPGTRVVVDTENKISVSGGNLVFAGGKATPANGDPGFYLDVITRVAGRVMVAEVTRAATNKYFDLGWDTEQGGVAVPAHSAGFRMQNNATFRIIEAGVFYTSSVGAYTATTYLIAVVLRATGAYYFVKGGTFTNWTLVWIGNTGTTPAVYPNLSNRDAAPTNRFIRVPARTWLPTPTAYDSFTRANGAIGTSEATGPDGQPCPARTWNNRVGTTQIATNKASASALVGGIAIATVDTGTVDVVMQGTLTSAGDEVGLVLRYVDADNYVRVEHDGTNAKVVKRLATVETDVISAVVALGAGAVQVVAEGTAFSLYLNNAQVGATSAIADAALQTGTEQGLFSTNVGNTQDAFLVMPRTGGNYSDLNRWSGVNP